MTTKLSQIYEPWGGNAELMASDIDEKPVTVRQWRNRGSIPPSYWPKIIKAAAARGIEMRVADFPPDDVVNAIAEQLADEREQARAA